MEETKNYNLLSIFAFYMHFILNIVVFKKCMYVYKKKRMTSKRNMVALLSILEIFFSILSYQYHYKKLLLLICYCYFIGAKWVKSCHFLPKNNKKKKWSLCFKCQFLLSFLTLTHIFAQITFRFSFFLFKDLCLERSVVKIN